MIPMTTEKKKLCLSLLGIFFVIFILNSFMVRSAGDDYVYSFMWEGHSMYEPLSSDARRIASFQDIAVSSWSYFLTWGGRIVAQSMAMFFLLDAARRLQCGHRAHGGAPRPSHAVDGTGRESHDGASGKERPYHRLLSLGISGEFLRHLHLAGWLVQLSLADGFPSGVAAALHPALHDGWGSALWRLALAAPLPSGASCRERK